jgi:hypothetical protein
MTAHNPAKNIGRIELLFLLTMGSGVFNCNRRLG